MIESRQSVWIASWLLLAVALGVGACGDGDDDGSNPTAGAGSGGETPTAGSAGNTSAGTGTSGTHHGGAGGQGGDAACVDGLQVVKVVTEAGRNIISWPEQRRVGVRVGRNIHIYAVADNGEISLVETVPPEALGLTADGVIQTFTRFGKGFVAQGATGDDPPEAIIVNWQPDAELEVIPALSPAPLWFTIGAADPDVGIAASTFDGIRLATLANDTWTWSEWLGGEGRRSSPLALEKDRLLVGIEEDDRLGLDWAGNEGGASAGGAGGEGGTSDTPIDARGARVEWWSLQGERLESYEALGNPFVASKTADGWLIGETNSFWGSGRAAVELLTASKLQTLTEVPVESSFDDIDGAYDVALQNERLFVANCESGLRAGDWSTTSVTLSSVPGPWQGEAICSPRQVETLDDLLVIGGDNLVFARACK